jgi:hypothetical protein
MASADMAGSQVWPTCRLLTAPIPVTINIGATITGVRCTL